jgi:hypothetical protein
MEGRGPYHSDASLLAHGRVLETGYSLVGAGAVGGGGVGVNTTWSSERA